MPETLWHTFFAHPSQAGKLYRPISCLTLALNWYIGGSNPIGYHIVNLIIHYGTSIFLFLAILQLLESPVFQNRYGHDGKYFIALLAVVLWSINPIQTQAVTYIIQRMASLAALFYIMAIYYYLKSRNTDSNIRYLIYCGICYLLALGSKENAVLLPMSLLLIEYIFYYRKTNLKDTLFLKILLVISLFICFFGVYFIYHLGILPNFFHLADARLYTYYQRLLTESRIVIFYLGLLFYPIPSRLSIDHDFPLSTSLFSPWTTTSSILAILFLIVLAFQQIKKRPLFSFAILFFFLNQLVESTVIPLELIFEHRNYLPSLFLFVPIAAVLHYILDHYRSYNRYLYYTISIFISLLIVFIGIGTYIRNMAYATTEGLWEDTLQKDPVSTRALSSLATLEGWGGEKSIERLQKALDYNVKASEGTFYQRTFKPAILINIGGIYYNYDQVDKAIAYFKKAIKEGPTYKLGYYNLARAYITKGDFKAGLLQIEYLIDHAFPTSRYYNLEGLALLYLEKPEPALVAFRKQMNLLPDKKKAFYNIGGALSLSGHFKQARWFLKHARTDERKNLRVALSALENSIRSGQKTLIAQDAQYIFSHFDMMLISKALKALPTEYSSVPVDVNLIRPIIEETATSLSKSILGDEPPLKLHPDVSSK